MPPSAGGSSPLARGTPRWVVPGADSRRFIPARAGNTDQRKLRQVIEAVHPRSRGEHQPANSNEPSPLGSSPLARGTLRARLNVIAPSRFIPARAGNTPRPGRGRSYRPVHPRSRGEHSTRRFTSPDIGGSSPLARGTPGNASADEQNGAVHPRSRGEHRPARTWSCRGSGSSPLARGTRWSRPCCGGRSRFIPARAGNTPRHWPRA